ncbi:MAG: hypothetical protein CMP61_01505 [Flavobacteriales bacterium]|nr:hypothetical protein [Flavobacteriales bacterium]|tara:strand:+ start:187 stop:3498 length:3312 start_codon:yes stop_codon:yes gene_type:complete
MKNILSLLAISFCSFLFAQTDYSFTSSGERFKKAYEHLLKEEYSAAFEYFDQVNPSDTLYDLVRFNKLVYQYNGNFYKDVVETGKGIIEDESIYTPEAYFYMIKALIDLRDYEKAKEGIQKAKKRFPLFFKYDFLDALMSKDKGEFEKAKKQFQTILRKHPKHSQSHYELAKIMADEAAETEAILGFQMAIMSNRNSVVLQKSFVGMEDVMQNNFEVTRSKDDNKLYKQINGFIASEIGLKQGYKADISLKYFSNNVTDLLFKQFTFKENTDDFTMNYYGRFFNEVKKNNLTKGYILYLLGVINNPVVQKHVTTFKSDIEAFEKFQKKYWKQLANENKTAINGKLYKREYQYDETGLITAVGKLNDKDKRVGPWVYFYPSGDIAAKTNYNEEGLLQGENIWFARDGYIKESADYEAGKITGHAFFTRDNGSPLYEGSFEENKAEGELTFYTNTGILSAKKGFKSNELEGEVKEYYTNGMLASKVMIKNGKNQGLQVVLYPTGDTISTKEFDKGKAVGKYESRHTNGKIASRGQYKSGKRIGKWVDYYYDGTVKYKYQYKNGNFHGAYLKFDTNGDTLVYGQYANSLLQGPYKDYSNNKVLWQHDYKKGKLKKYYNYSPSGTLINKGKKNYNLNDKFGFKYIEGTKKGNDFHGDYIIYWKNGKVKEKRVYEKGVRQGEHKEYYAWGELEVETNYKDDELHGLYKAYYDNGELYCEGHYFEGEEIGLWKFYHPNGNLKKTYYYSDGESIGHHIYYSISGEKKADYFYKDEILYNTKVFNSQGEVVCNIKTPQGKGVYHFTNVEGYKILKSNLDGGKHHGKKQFFYPNGQLMESVEKKHGESHGKFQSFYPNGQLKEEGVYVFGAKQGEWKSYHHNGKLSRKARYVDNYVRDSIVEYFITGEVDEITYYDANGNQTQVHYMHPSGKTNSVVTFDDGFIQGNYSNYDGLGQLVINRTYNGGENITYSYEKNGKLIEPISITNDKPIQTYYNNGQLASEYQYVDGLFEGAYKRNHSNGNPWIVANYLHDDVHGTYRAYYVDGTLRYEGEYDNGRLNGKMKKYAKNGQLLMDVSYVFGVKEGLAHFYNNNGKLLYTLTYKDDVVVKVNK